jgi:hypothetical protein
MWEWDVGVSDIQEGVEGDHAPVCVGGRGCAPGNFGASCRHVGSISGIYRANGVLAFYGFMWPRLIRFQGLARGVGFGRALAFILRKEFLSQ